MSYKNSFNKLRITALAAFFSFANPVSADTEANAEPQKSNFFYSDKVEKNYGHELKAIQKFVPDVSVLVISSEDFNISLTAKEKGALEYMENYGEELLASTPENKPIIKKLHDARDQLRDRIIQSSSVASPLLPKTALANIQKNNPQEFNNLITDIAAKTLGETIETVSLNSFFHSYPDINSAVIILPPDLNDVTYFTEGLSGLPATSLENVQSIASDFRLFFLGHQIAGRALNSQNLPEANRNDIDIKFTDAALEISSRCDIAAATVFKRAKEENLTSGADTPAEYAALRALGNFFLSPNQINSIQDINTYNTTLLFDPKSENYSSSIDLGKIPSVSALPILINHYADAIIGFTALQDYKDGIDNNPASFASEQKLLIGSLSTDAAAFYEHLDKYAALGESIRTGYAIDNSFEQTTANPQYLYAALAYIRQNNLLADVKSSLTKDYTRAIDDLLDDFLNAAKIYAPQLQNAELSEKMHKKMESVPSKKLGYNKFFAPLDEQEATAEYHAYEPQIN